MAFHPLHTLSFPWPASGQEQNEKLPKTSFFAGTVTNLNFSQNRRGCTKLEPEPLK
jgi:hypothetical protein